MARGQSQNTERGGARAAQAAGHPHLASSSPRERPAPWGLKVLL